MSKQPKCKIECICICHDTGGADYGMHGDNGRCPPKDGKELDPLKINWLDSHQDHDEYYDDADGVHRCLDCHKIVDPDELDWKKEDNNE